MDSAGCEPIETGTVNAKARSDATQQQQYSPVDTALVQQLRSWSAAEFIPDAEVNRNYAKSIECASPDDSGFDTLALLVGVVGAPDDPAAEDAGRMELYIWDGTRARFRARMYRPSLVDVSRYAQCGTVLCVDVSTGNPALRVAAATLQVRSRLKGLLACRMAARIATCLLRPLGFAGRTGRAV